MTFEVAFAFLMLIIIIVGALWTMVYSMGWVDTFKCWGLITLVVIASILASVSVTTIGEWLKG